MDKNNSLSTDSFLYKFFKAPLTFLSLLTTDSPRQHPPPTNPTFTTLPLTVATPQKVSLDVATTLTPKDSPPPFSPPKFDHVKMPEMTVKVKGQRSESEIVQKRPREVTPMPQMSLEDNFTTPPPKRLKNDCETPSSGVSLVVACDPSSKDSSLALEDVNSSKSADFHCFDENDVNITQSNDNTVEELKSAVSFHCKDLVLLKRNQEKLWSEINQLKKMINTGKNNSPTRSSPQKKAPSPNKNVQVDVGFKSPGPNKIAEKTTKTTNVGPKDNTKDPKPNK